MKAFHELNESFPSLLDPDGNRKPFERFLNDVRAVDETYNANYLRSEYNFIHASASMAAKWEQYAEDGDRYNLQYRTAGDDRVRPEHAALDGVTLPMDDPFWEEYYVPNGWNCRCSVVQVRKSKYPTTDHDEAMRLGQLAIGQYDMFRFNSGKQQKAVPDYNPYTIRQCRTCPTAKGDGKANLASGAPMSDLCQACQAVRTCWMKKKDSEPETFETCPTDRGKVRVSSKHGRNEKRENVRGATYLANKHGYEIDLIANPPDRKSADSFNRTLGYTQEYKVGKTPTVSSIDNLLRDGARQSDSIVLFVESDISLAKLSNAINGRVSRTRIKEVTVVIDGKDRTYKRDEMISDDFMIKQADLK